MGSTISDKGSRSLVKVTAVSKALIGPRDQIAHVQRYTSGAIDVRKALIGCIMSPRVRRVYFRLNLSCRPRRGDISAIYRIRCTLVKERPLVNGSISCPNMYVGAPRRSDVTREKRVLAIFVRRLKRRCPI